MTPPRTTREAVMAATHVDLSFTAGMLYGLVSRARREGMSWEWISEYTFIPVELLKQFADTWAAR